MSISPEQRARFLCEVTRGAALQDAAEAAGVSLKNVFLLRSRDAGFARELAEARRTAP